MYEEGVTDFRPQLVLNGIASRSSVDAVLGKEVRSQLPGMTIVSVDPVRDRIGAVFASMGLYASLDYFVRHRRRDLAIRMCLGASSSSIRRIVYGRAVLSAGLGVLFSVIVWPLLARLSSVEYLGAHGLSRPDT